MAERRSAVASATTKDLVPADEEERGVGVADEEGGTWGKERRRPPVRAVSVDSAHHKSLRVGPGA